MICLECIKKEKELASAQLGIDALRAELEETQRQLDEMTKYAELQAADLKRYKQAIDSQHEQHQPERVAKTQLQLALERVLASVTDKPTRDALDKSDDLPSSNDNSATPPKKRKGGRRKISLENLPVQEERLVPAEVTASGGEGWVLIGEETSDRLAYQPAQFFRLHVVREKYKRVVDDRALVQIVTAPLPGALWPHTMADVSVIVEHVMAKYDYSIPLNRQERMTDAHGFAIPRSTQADWIGAAHEYALPVVEAMHAESIAKSIGIATDATSAPVRAPKTTNRWHVFVFISDVDHVTFGFSRSHTQAAIVKLLEGFTGRLLSDASNIYEALYRLGVVAVVCWVHMRRYFWKATLTEPELAHEALALIERLFKIARAAKKVPVSERTEYRRELAQPVLDVFDDWIERNRDVVDPRGRLDAAITYYTNQRTALHRFLEDGRIELDNNGSERELRNLVLGRQNWKHFENRTGLQWYTTFRSLIASCRVQGLNAHDYLEQMLRLAPHWPRNRVLELAPKYWCDTVAALDDGQRAIIHPPWRATAPPSSPAEAQRPARTA